MKVRPERSPELPATKYNRMAVSTLTFRYQSAKGQQRSDTTIHVGGPYNTIAAFRYDAAHLHNSLLGQLACSTSLPLLPEG